MKLLTILLALTITAAAGPVEKTDKLVFPSEHETGTEGWISDQRAGYEKLPLTTRLFGTVPLYWDFIDNPLDMPGGIDPGQGLWKYQSLHDRMTGEDYGHP